MYIQAISILAFAIICYACTIKDDKKMINLLSVGSLTMSVHFGLQELYAPCAILLYDTMRNQLSIRLKTRYIAYLLVLGYVIIGLFTAKENIQFIPVISGVCGTLAFFFLKDIKLRMVVIFNCAIWFAHDYYYQSIGGMMVDVSMIALNLFAISKMVFDNRKTVNLNKEVAF